MSPPEAGSVSVVLVVEVVVLVVLVVDVVVDVVEVVLVVVEVVLDVDVVLTPILAGTEAPGRNQAPLHSGRRRWCCGRHGLRLGFLHQLGRRSRGQRREGGAWREGRYRGWRIRRDSRVGRRRGYRRSFRGDGCLRGPRRVAGCRLQVLIAHGQYNSTTSWGSSSALAT